MMQQFNLFILLLCVLYPIETSPFVIYSKGSSTAFQRTSSPTLLVHKPVSSSLLSSSSSSSSDSENNENEKEYQVYLRPELTNENIKSLYAWICRAFDGEEQYGNLMLAMAAIFSDNTPPDLIRMVQDAKDKFQQRSLSAAATSAVLVDGTRTDDEEEIVDEESILCGQPISRIEREQHSLGAMGAGQWTGQYRTRPHAILNIQNMTSVNDWITSLPRGCKRTLKKADQQNFTITTLPIQGRQPAPHSSLAHFRCVVEHEVRLITGSNNNNETIQDLNGFLDALSEAVGRYVGTTRMTGVIQEYRNQDDKVIAFAHEVQKGRTIRGQWFYATNEAAKNYVWFHSVKELVSRAIESESIDCVDLGPSGSDAFSDLKARYKFESVVDWPMVADYNGPFWYDGEDIDENDDDDDERKLLMKLLRALGE